MKDFAPFERIKILFQLSDKPKSLVDFLIGCGFDIFSKPQLPQIFRKRKRTVIGIFQKLFFLLRRYPHIDSKSFTSHKISILSFVCDGNDGCDGHFAIP